MGSVEISGAIGSVGDIVGRDRIEINTGPRTPVPVPSEQAPMSFIERPEVTDGLLAFLLSDAPTPRGRAMISAVHGLGGMGKTTVARWLMWRPEVEARFADGRIWVTLGSEPPNALTVLNEVAGRLDSTLKPKSTLEAARADLSAALHQRSILLVIDDIWPGESFNVACSLMVPSARSRFLLTTRFPDLGTTTELRAVSFPLDEMSSAQGTALIASILGREINAGEVSLAAQLCDAVGGHPLALELAAARIRGGFPWQQLLADLAAEIARLDELAESDDLAGSGITTGDDAGRKRRSVQGSLLLSVRYLNVLGRELFTWLGVTVEDAVITPAMASTLWSLDFEASRRHLRALNGSGLLRAEGGGYQLHDLVLDVARNLLAAPPTPCRDGDLPGLGISLQYATALLLQRYRNRCRGGLWHTLEDDGYIHEHLVQHLTTSGWADALEALLWEESDIGLCGWYEVRQRLGQIAGYLADVRRIWSHADARLANSSSAGETAGAVGLQLHCALIMSSITSLSAAIPSEVLAGAVRYGTLSLPAALALVRQHPHSGIRAFALIELLGAASPKSRPAMLDEACTAARTAFGLYWNDGRLQEALVEAIRLLPPTEALALAVPLSQLGDAPVIAKELDAQRSAATAPHLTFERKLAIALETVDPIQRTELLIELGQHWTLPRDALDSTMVWLERAGVFYIKAPWAMATLAKQLSPERRAAAMEMAQQAARKLHDPRWCAVALAAVAAELNGRTQLAIFSEAMQAARRVDGAVRRTAVMASVVQQMPQAVQGDALSEVLAHVRAIDDPDRRAMALGEVLQKLPRDLPIDRVEELFAASGEISNPRSRAMSLIEAARQTCDETRQRFAQYAFAAARDIKDGEDQVQALFRIVRRLPADLRADTLGKTFELAGKIEVTEQRTALMGKLVRMLPPQRALPLALGISDPRERGRALVHIARRLPTEATLAVVRSIGAQYRGEALLEMARRMSAAQALALANQIDSAEQRARLLTGLVFRLKRPARSLAIEQALDSTRSLREAWSRAKALALLARQLPATMRGQVESEALAAAQSGLAWQRSEALAQVARLLPVPLALEAARGIPRAQYRGDTLLRLVARLPADVRPALLNEALTTLVAVQDPFERAILLRRAARHFPPAVRAGILEAALSAAREEDEPVSQAEALAIVARSLPEPLQGDVFLEVVEIERSLPSWRGLEFLKRVTKHLPVELIQKLACNLGQDGLAAETNILFFRRALRGLTPERALAVARRLSRPDERSRLVVEAARRLSGVARDVALAEALATVCQPDQPVDDYLVLQVARSLPAEVHSDLLGQVIQTARRMEATPARQYVLAEVARRLPHSMAQAVTAEIDDAWQRLHVHTSLPAQNSVVDGTAVPLCDWVDAVRTVAQRDRQRCMRGLASITSAIATIGGGAAVQSLARSTLSVGRWWP